MSVQLLDELKPRIIKCVSLDRGGGNGGGDADDSGIAPSDIVESYISNYTLVAGQLRGLVYKTLCPRLLGYPSVSLMDHTKCRSVGCT